MLPDSKDSKLGNSEQQSSPSGGKNTGIVLVPCFSFNNFEPHSFLKISSTNIQGLRSNFVECESFLADSFLKISLSLVCKLTLMSPGR